jgi:serine/threonine-protein kinase
MGEVYLAKDTKLDRKVAIKILPDNFAQDAGRMARFEREAKVLASLNHPHIAHIYGVEDRALVMELVEGESPKGPMPFDEAWKIASQIADALEYAHEHGVVHRDLKPANVKVTPDGVVKLLDFGLAKALSDTPDSPSGDPVNSPTMTLGATTAGTIMGTAAYMAPEQAKGKRVDKRADIWSWGVMLYELLTGERMFKGDDVSDTLAQVLTKEPDLSAVPVKVRKLLCRCLEKDPKQRLRDIGEARFLLASETAAVPVASRWPWIVATGAAALAIALGVVTWRLWPKPAELKPLIRLSVDLGPDAVAGGSTTVAISPDGTRIVFPVRGQDGVQRLATRLLDQQKESVLAGTENGRDAFFSPDGKWVGLFADGKMKKMSVLGGAPVTLCNMGNPRGASWGEDGSIYTAPNASDLLRLPESGGEPKAIGKPSGQLSQRWPQALPHDRGVLFTGTDSNTSQETATIQAWIPGTSEIKKLLQNGYFGRFLLTGDENGYLLYIHEGTLFAVPFGLNGLNLRGVATPILEDLAANLMTGGGQFDFSQSGTLVYLAGKSTDDRQAVWLDSTGKAEPFLPQGQQYGVPHFSPDGKSLAFAVSSGNAREMHVYELERKILRRITFTQGSTNYPVWSPDGKHVAFSSVSSSGRSIGWARADGGGQFQQLIESKATAINPYSFSPDGRRLSYYEVSPETRSDIFTVALDLSDPDHPKAGTPEAFLRTRFAEQRGAFSPDGRWMAYESDESGISQVYVQPFPGPGGKWQISNTSGRFATWSRDGKQLFFETLDGYIMVTDYTVKGDSFVPGLARQWSPTQLRDIGALNMTLHPDGKRFVAFPVATKSEQQGNLHATFLFNFADELRRRLPAGGSR